MRYQYIIIMVVNACYEYIILVVAYRLSPSIAEKIGAARNEMADNDEDGFVR